MLNTSFTDSYVYTDTGDITGLSTVRVAQGHDELPVVVVVDIVLNVGVLYIGVLYIGTCIPHKTERRESFDARRSGRIDFKVVFCSPPLSRENQVVLVGGLLLRACKSGLLL